MKKRCIVLSTIFMLGLFLFLASPEVSNADFTFSNTVSSIEENSWTHALEVEDFSDPDIDSFDGVTITSATLTLLYSVNTHAPYNIYAGAAIGEEDYIIGWIIADADTTGEETIFTITCSSLASLADNFQLNIHVDDIVGGEINVTEATLTGSAVPIPSIALLIGTAFTGLAMFRRQVFTS